MYEEARIIHFTMRVSEGSAIYGTVLLKCRNKDGMKYRKGSDGYEL